MSDAGSYVDRPRRISMSQLTLKQAIGQLFMVGIGGTEVDSDFESLVKRWHVGNIVLFARNLTDGDQATELTQSLQDLIEPETTRPAFISADQEGGIVLRLVQGATPFPGNMAVGATGRPAYAEQIAYAIGVELLSLGINMNLAPVLDINNNRKNPVIGVRSFGTKPEQVAQLGTAAVRGYHRAGIACVAKHFPGHGDSEVDSHSSLPTIARELDELAVCELVPFKEAIDSGLSAVMTAHIAFPALDTVPATLSHTILTTILRKRMGFKGLILTDSMRMAGVTSQYGPEQAAVMALKAGCDMLLYSAMGAVEERAIKAVHDAVASGELSEERIYQSVQRIEAAKSQIAEPTQPDLAAHQGLALEVSRAAITLSRDRAGLVPLPTQTSVTVIEVTRRAITQVEEQLKEAGLASQLQRALPHAQYLTIPANPDEPAVSEVCSQIDGETVVVITQDAWRNPGQQRLLESLVDLRPGRVVLVAGRLPYDVDLMPQIPTAICTYDMVTTSIQALVEVLTGELEPIGVMP